MNLDFNADKNAKLISERNISFEEAIAAIYSGGLLDIIEHPNKEKDNHQKIYVLNINNYVHLVPFTKNKNMIHLKTIFPSRKLNKIYLEDKENE